MPVRHGMVKNSLKNVNGGGQQNRIAVQQEVTNHIQMFNTLRCGAGDEAMRDALAEAYTWQN